jgi:hypothetical protein
MGSFCGVVKSPGLGGTMIWVTTGTQPSADARTWMCRVRPG